MRRSLANSSAKNDNSFNLALFEQALKDPNSKDLILKLLTSHTQKQNVFQLFKEQPNPDSVKSPLKKFKRKNVCESPTALLRRRELEKMNRPESAQSNDSESTQSSSSDLPFERILKDVIAYVEVNSNGNDRSGGVKALLRSMGAIVKDNFTKDVTHVIFKDGSYHTYQKAKLSKVHFVSVLWLETTRRNGVRAPERNYPALGTKNYDLNISLICSQMQKDYEEVVKEEIRRTLESGTPLPSTKSSLENRRRTIASTSKSFSSTIRNNNSNFYSSETPKRKQEQSSSSLDEELSCLSQNVQKNLENNNLDSFSYQSSGKENANSALLTSDSETKDSEVLTSDSECGMVNGVFTGSNLDLEDSFDERSTVGPLKISNSCMEITCESDDSNSRSLIFDRQIIRRKSKNLTRITEDSMDLTNVETKNDAKTPKNNSSNKAARIEQTNSDETSDEEIYRVKTPILNNKNRKILHPISLLSQENSKNKDINNDSTMSSLRISNENSKENRTNSTTDMSSLKISKENNDKSSSSVMSSLRISADMNSKSSSLIPSLRVSGNSKENISSNNRSSSQMSSLRISSEKEKNINERLSQEKNFNNEKMLEKEKDDKEVEVSTPFVTERKKKRFSRNISKKNEKENENIIINEEDSTPFVTMRNKKRVIRESSNQSALSGIDVLQSSIDFPTPRRETLEVKKEIKNFEDNARNRKSFHDKSREVELNLKGVDGIDKNLPPLPVVSSPFITTRTRRKTVRMTKIREEGDEIGSGIDLNNEELLNEEIPTGETDHEKNEDELMPKKKRRSSRISSIKNNVVKAKNFSSDTDSLSNITEDSSPKEPIQEKSNTTPREPIILLQNVLVSPQKNQETKEEKPKRKPENKNEKKNEDVRRSTRIRKLYDPDDVEQEFRVDDNEERERIRTEKTNLPKGVVSFKNVLLTQKALEFLEKNRNNGEGIRTLFKSPATVLGIEKKERVGVEKRGGSVLNRSADEQVQLAEEIMSKRTNRAMTQPTPAIQRTPKTRTRLLTQRALTTTRKKETSNRRSTLEFEPCSLRSRRTVKSRLQFDPKPTIVCTKMHKPEVELFQQIVKKLGVFEVVDEVDANTTHLVAGELKRTVNMLRALARGCWILKKEWLLSSLEHRKWLPEEKYEAVEFSPAVQKCRLERSAFGRSYRMNIFMNCGKIYVAKSTTPRCSDLRELIATCHGKIARTSEGASIAVGAFFDDVNVTCVNEQWVLDSISEGKLKPLKKYLIEKQVASWITKSPFV